METLQRKLSNTKGDSGMGSFTLTLPKQWCNEKNLNHGDEVELLLDQITPSSILIQIPQKKITGRKSELVISDKDHHTGQARRRSILGGYLEGYDTIRLIKVSRDSGKRIAIRQDIQELTQKLDGCSFDEGADRFDLTVTPGLRSPNELLNRLYSTTKLMFQDVFRAYTDYDIKLAQDLVQRDDQADKLYFAMVRTLKLILRQPFKVSEEKFSLVDTMDFRLLSSNLENLCDAAENVAEAIWGNNEDGNLITKEEVEELSKTEKKRILDIGSELLTALNDSFEYYSTNDEKSAVRLSARKSEMDEFQGELRDMRIHQSLIDVVDEAVETIVDLLELVHANPDESNTQNIM